MTGSEIRELFERIGRLVAAAEQKSGDGTALEYTFPDGETHRYVIRGLKSHAEIEDTAYNLLIWIWNAKDYLKRRAVTLGKDGRSLEKAVNIDVHLPLCADLANRLKHGELRQSRSGHHPRPGKISFAAPQASLGSLTFRAFEVELQMANPSLVQFYLPVFDHAGEQIGDAFDYAAGGVAALERLRDEVDSAA